MSKVVLDANEAISNIKDGDVLMLGGFGLCRLPKRPEDGERNMTTVIPRVARTRAATLIGMATLLAGAGLCSTAAAVINIPTVPIGDPGNHAESTVNGPFGSVAYSYKIGSTEVHNSKEMVDAVRGLTGPTTFVIDRKAEQITTVVDVSRTQRFVGDNATESSTVGVVGIAGSDYGPVEYTHYNPVTAVPGTIAFTGDLAVEIGKSLAKIPTNWARNTPIPIAPPLCCAAENRSADANAGGAFFDGHLEIVGHAHRQAAEIGLRVAPRQPVAQFPQADEHRSGLLGRLDHGRHRHQP